MKKLVFAAAIAVAGFAGAASATPVHVDYQTAGNAFGSENLKERVGVQAPGVRGYVSAGLYQMTGDSGFGDFAAFCVDLAEGLRDSTDYDVDPNLFAQSVRDNVARLFNSVLGGSAIADVIDTNRKAAGFQVALWEVVTETSSYLNVYDGAFRVFSNRGVARKAQHYLDGMRGASTVADGITYLSHDGRQDLVTYTPPVSNVPVPAAGLLLLTGLGGMVAMRRRKKS